MANKVAIFLLRFCLVDYKVLARKWRPKVFAEVAGQKPILQALQYALKSGRVHHAYLFTGTRGVGKTTIARILAKALSCEQGVVAEPCNHCANCQAIDDGKYIDVLEVDAASRTKVEDTRELLDNVAYAPVQGRYKIYIIDEVHMLSNHSFNALLKTLEEPPGHVKFLFATTDPHKLPITILSRCLQFQLSSFSAAEILTYIQHVLTAEKISFEFEALRKISMAANGSVRDALTLLEQVISLGQENITDAIVLQVLGIANYELIIDLLSAVMTGDPQKAFAIIEQLKTETVDFNKILQELLVMLHKIAVVQVLPNYLTASDLWQDKLLLLAKTTPPEYVQLFYQIGVNGKKDLPYAPDLILGFEMILLRMLTFQPVQIVAPDLADHHVEKESYSITTPKVEPKQIKPPVTENIGSVAHDLAEVIYDEIKQPVKQDLASVVPDWAEVIYEMKLVGLTKAIAQHCAITSWQQDKVVLTLDPMHKASLQPHHAQKIQDALQKYLGHKVQVKINLDQVLAETPALQQQNKQIKIEQAAETLIRGDAQVQNILVTFDAKIERIIVKDQE